MKKIFISILINICIVGKVFSAFSLFNLGNLNNQLSNNAILSMYQDRYGFMWFGTYDGLNLYDGKDVTTFRFESANPYSLSGNSIHKIIQADQDHLWIATHVGLDKFSLKDRKVVESYMNYEKIEFIATNDNNETWLIDKDNFISYYNNSQKKFFEIQFKDLKINDIRSLFVDENNHLCLINKEGKLQMIALKSNDKQEKNYSLVTKEESFHNKIIRNVFYEDRRIYFIDEKNDLYVYDKANQQKIYLRNITDIVNQYGGSITSLCTFKNDIFITFLHGGLIKIDMANNDQWEPINTSIGIFGLLKDRNQDAIWVATDGRGVELYYSERNTFGNILFDNLPFTARRPVRAIYTDENNTLWIGSKGDGIIKIKDYDKFSNKQVPKANAQNIAEDIHFRYPVYCFVRSKYNKQDLWIGGDMFSYYSYRDNKIYSVVGSDGQSANLSDIHALCEVNDSTLWISSFGLWKVIIDKTTTPYKIKKQTKQIFLKEGKNNIDDVFFSMLYDKDSTLSLGSRRGYGVIQYNIHNAKYQYVSIDKVDNKGLGDVICLYPKGDSILYIGSSSGLTVVGMAGGKENKVKQFGRKDGIINDMIHGILEDNSGIIWLSTSKGLVKYNPKNDSFFNVKSSKIGIAEFSDDAYWHCPISNRLFFGGVNGLTWVEPKAEQSHLEYEPDLLFTELKLYGKGQTLYEYNEDKTKKIVLPIDQNTFQISFAVLDYINGDNYDYSYMLEGYDIDWNSLQKENQISFTRLPSGEYTLKVKYKNDVVNADNKVYSISIVILPPWYLSQIAYAIYSLLFILLIISVYYYVKRRFRRKQEILAKRIKREEQEKLYESKMRFFTNVTHELFTPLTLINGALDQIKEANEPDKIDKYTVVLQNNVLNLNELIQEILDYRRIEEGHVGDLTLKKISVTDLTNKLIDSYSAMVKQNNIHLEVSIPANLYWYTDKSSLKKIISNLLSNAFKYTPEQGIIRVNLYEDCDFLKIAIYNTGRGIEKEKLKSVFNRFQILEDTDVNANNQMTARNGLGLSICYNMTKLLGGDLTVESEVDQYAQFTVILPSLVEEKKLDANSDTVYKRSKEIDTRASNSSHVSPTAMAINSDTHVLIVDDNKEIVELLSDILSVQYIVSKTYSVAEAQQVLKDNAPALIITDIMMPEIDGLSFVRMLRDNKYYKHLPIIALSARVDETDIISGYEIGADAYITKPFSSDILLSIVNRLIVNKEEIRKFYNTAESAFSYSSEKLIHTEDKEFVNLLSEIIKSNINNPELGPDFIADKMNISSRTLYRQLKKILSISISDFIKDYRLAYSTRLLLTTNLSIKEIIYKIGFSNKSYFYNEFFKKYNMTPKQFRGTNTDEEL